MGFLVPLYLAGLAALSLPLIFHLVRRTPRGRQDFSSLMFLAPTPPKLTRRSRLDQILLLVLRLTALSLLAIAFARPFLREAAALSLNALPGRRVAILLDTSASMRRGEIWQEALRKAEHELDQLGPADDVALFAFDDRLSRIVPFDDEDQATGSGKPETVRAQVRALKPSWGATDLGTALVTVAGEMDATGDARQSRLEPQMIVISDFQKGSQIEALQAFEWPERVPVVFRPVISTRRTNASARLVTDEEATDDAANVRVRVVNAADSTGDQFYVGFGSGPDRNPAAGTRSQNAGGAEQRAKDAGGTASSSEIAVYVPAGQSRTVRLPRAAGQLSADRIVLRGDDHDFDNTFYVVPPRKQNIAILYAGRDIASDARGLLYYLRLAVANDPLREVEVRPVDVSDGPPDFGDPAPRLIVVSQSVERPWQAHLREFVETGGFLLLVPTDDLAAGMLPSFFEGLELTEDRKAGGDYRLLGDIDFAHPLFAPFANPRYSDFTKIHFWKQRHIAVPKTVADFVAARFDNGDPAMLERSLGRGRVIALASGWHPNDSQLALSSKFVPFIGGILDRACGSTEVPSTITVHSPIPLPQVPNAVVTVRTPGGRLLRPDAQAQTVLEAEEPGIYDVISGTEEARWAVNLAASERDTAPLELEQLEQRGVRVGTALSKSERMDRIRQERDIELENRQRVWRWLIAGALGLLLMETWLAGRAERKIARGVPLSPGGLS